jgi:hypothetical protein
MTLSLLLGFALHTITWEDLPPSAKSLAKELSLTGENFEETVAAIRARNANRLREGEIDHLIFYMLQARDFTAAAPVDPAAAATSDVRQRISDLVRALAKPADERQKYLATLLPPEPEAFLEEQLRRVVRWIHEKEIGCRSAPSPQTCIAALYPSRGHSSDTSPESIASVRAAFEWLHKNRSLDAKRILIIGPGSDFAPRTGLRSGPARMYQPRQVRDLAGQAVVIDCVDLNPRVVRAAAPECEHAEKLDIATERMDRRYDAIIATNVLLYLNQRELLLAFNNVRAMLAENGVFIHNDTRFETHVFGRAAGLPAVHFGTVTLDSTRRPVQTDHSAIQSTAVAKL